MKEELKKNIIEGLKKISEDMEYDAKHFDGEPFNGKTVAQYLGFQGAAIAAMADILSLILKGGLK